MIDLKTADLDELLDWVLPGRHEPDFFDEVYDGDPRPQWTASQFLANEELLEEARWFIKKQISTAYERTLEYAVAVDPRRRGILAFQRHGSDREEARFKELRLKYFKKLTELELVFLERYTDE